MASLTDLSYTNNMATTRKPLLTDLVESLDSIETYTNDTLKDNLVQLAVDAFPSGYAFDSDGAKNFATYNLYDKQTTVDSDTTGNHTIATTAAWTDVDATNAAITFIPDHLTGDFRVTFQFNVESVTSNATNETDVRFRLTDSTTNSTAIANVHFVTGVTATTSTIPVTLCHEFDNLTGDVSATIKLQYYITTSTASVIK